jgi:hypothetical protein
MAEFLAVGPNGNDAPYPNKEDDIRLIRHTQPLAAICLWLVKKE